MSRSVLAAALAGLLCACPTAIAAGSTGPVLLTASLPPGAEAGRETSLRLGLRIDPRRLPSPVREVRLRFPASLGIATSGLGAEVCRRSVTEFEAVMIDGRGLAGCSPNAVMGRGTARAEVRLGGTSRANALVIPELATVSMLAAPFEKEQFGLLFLANGMRPFGVTLLYGGVIERASPPWGGVLLLRVRPVPNTFDAEVALLGISCEIGAPGIRYTERRGERTVRYRPEAIQLPLRCPRGGFPFHAILTLADGRRATADTAMSCPRTQR